MLHCLGKTRKPVDRKQKYNLEDVTYSKVKVYKDRAVTATVASKNFLIAQQERPQL